MMELTPTSSAPTVELLRFFVPNSVAVTLVECVELSRNDVVLRTSVAAHLQKNTFRNGLIKTVVDCERKI